MSLKTIKKSPLTDRVGSPFLESWIHEFALEKGSRPTQHKELSELRLHHLRLEVNIVDHRYITMIVTRAGPFPPGDISSIIVKDILPPFTESSFPLPFT